MYVHKTSWDSGLSERLEVMSRMPSFTQRTESASGAHGAEHIDPPMTVSYECPKPRQRGPPVWGDRDKVVLLVDNKRFTICPLLLTKEPNTMLGR